MDPYEPFGDPPVAAGGKMDGRWVPREEEAFPARAAMDSSYRRRSPAQQQDRRRMAGRGRSRSPVTIDRYQPGERDRPPREDYYAAARDREDRRRMPSPPSAGAANIDRYVPGQAEPTKPMVRGNPLPHPLSLDYPVGFNWFAEWWRTEQAIKDEKDRTKHGGRRPTDRVKGEREARDDREKERAQIQVAYDAYKAELQVKLAKSFVHQHRNEEWFKEKYVPEIRNPLRRRLMDFRIGSSYQQWLHDVDAGLFDDFTLEGIYKSESDGAGGIIEKEEGEATAVGETLSVLDLVPSRGGDLRDDTLLQPALLIKTLAPNVSRDKIEEFCKEHLGEGSGGFKWLSLSDPNPSKKYHRIGWIMVHPGEEGPAVIERGDGREEEGEEGENGEIAAAAAGDGAGAGGAGGAEGSSVTAEKALEAINGKTIYDPTRGDFTCHVGVHAPPSNPRKKALWDLFSAPERIDRDLQLAKRLVAKLDSEASGDAATSVDGFAKIEERVDDVRGKGWLQPPVTGPVKVKKSRTFDPDADMVMLEEGEEDEEGEAQEVEEEDEETDSEDLLVKKKMLDMAVEYLRRVYNFCFFCVFESDSVHELARKCPGGHLRRPRSGLSTHAKAAAKASALGQPYPSKRKKEAEPLEEGEEPTAASASSPTDEKKGPRYSNKSDQQSQRAFNWVRTFEDKLLQILEPENADLKKLGGKPVEEALEEELAKFVKQEDEAKFRCKVPECTKLFKSQHFWRKHVEKRHPEWFAEIQKDLMLVNNYALDPAHISPSRSDTASNGHFPFTAGHMPTGTPRGFNLANVQFNNFPGGNGPMMGMQGMPPNFPGFANGGGAGMPPHHGASADQHSGLHNPGVIRRGGGRHGNRPGPYDRRGGRGGPMGGGGGGGPGGGRFPPNAAAAAAAAAGYIPPGHPAAAAMAGFGGPPGGGGQAMAPKEAVQGRSLKSYEDLDAVGGPGGGELNY